MRATSTFGRSGARLAWTLLAAAPAAGQTTERVSVASNGLQANVGCQLPSISADGRCVAFSSDATNLVPGDTNFTIDIFVRDRQTGTTERVSIDSSGAQGHGACYTPAISADGRFVAFKSLADDLVPGDTNGLADIFVRDRLAGTTERVSVDSSGMEGDGPCESPSISADGRFVAFTSYSGNLVPGDTNGGYDVFVRDRLSGATERVSVDSSGAEGNHWSLTPSISGDGRWVAFTSYASNLVPGDGNGTADAFVRDRLSGTTERVSVDSGGAQGNGISQGPAISANGRFVVFLSLADDLVPGDTNAGWDIFERDRQNGTTTRVSVSWTGTQANNGSAVPSVSADGQLVAFQSDATNLVPGDTNGVGDVFVHVRPAPGFLSTCDPGSAGVVGCPCSNPPSGAQRGCENSAATGGSALTATGSARLSNDSLVFQTNGERPTATSIVLQGTVEITAGVVFGQGVSCVGGMLKRLYNKTASGGSIRAPEFGAGEPSVSARSAALGDPIQAGQSRWYLVYYRDPIVLGGCPGARTFNATQTGRVDWSL